MTLELSPREEKGCAVFTLVFVVPALINVFTMLNLSGKDPDSVMFGKLLLFIPWPICVISGLVWAYRAGLFTPYNPDAQLMQKLSTGPENSVHAGNDPRCESLANPADLAELARFTLGQLYRGRSPEQAVEAMLENGVPPESAVDVFRSVIVQLPFTRIRDGVETGTGHCDLCLKDLQRKDCPPELIYWRKEVASKQLTLKNVKEVTCEKTIGRYFLCSNCMSNVRPEFGSCLKITLAFAIAGVITGFLILPESPQAPLWWGFFLALLGSCWGAAQPGRYTGPPVNEGFKLEKTTWDNKRSNRITLKFLIFYSVIAGVGYWAVQNGIL